MTSSKVDDAKGVSALGATADDQATVAGWSEVENAVVRVRQAQPADARRAALFGLGEPLPPLEDDLEEFNKDESDEDATAAGDDDDAGPASDDDERGLRPTSRQAGGQLGSKSGGAVELWCEDDCTRSYTSSSGGGSRTHAGDAALAIFQ